MTRSSLLGLLAVAVLVGLFLQQRHENQRRLEALRAELQATVANAAAQKQRVEVLQSTLQDVNSRLVILDGEMSAASGVRETRDKLLKIERQVQEITRQSFRRGQSGIASIVPEYDPTQPSSALEPATSEQDSTTNTTRRGWSPEQVTGPPDTHTSGDIPTAWASREADAGPEWLWVEYGRDVPLAEVRIRETYNPGAISKVSALINGQEVVLWEGTAARASGIRDFVVPVNQNIVARSILVTLDSQRVPGWNEIDAVELVGRDGSRQWAISASASSTYADRSTAIPGDAVQTFQRAF